VGLVRHPGAGLIWASGAIASSGRLRRHEYIGGRFIGAEFLSRDSDSNLADEFTIALQRDPAL
jgi:hypothetical protein